MAVARAKGAVSALAWHGSRSNARHCNIWVAGRQLGQIFRVVCQYDAAAQSNRRGDNQRINGKFATSPH